MVTIATWQGDDNYVVKMAIKRSDMASLWVFPSWLTASGLSARRRIAQPSMQGSLCGGWYSGEPRDISEFVGIENLPRGTTAAT